MNITTYFSTSGIPATGLTPELTVWELDGSSPLSGVSMTEVAGGFYYYNFTGYDYTVDYVFQAYESSLSPYEQYSVGTNEADIINESPLMKQILGLSQSNFEMTGQTYSVSGSLETCVINIYPTAADLSGGTNVTATYDVLASYDVNGLLDDYKVTKR